jgi:hypothetical protein
LRCGKASILFGSGLVCPRLQLQTTDVAGFCAKEHRLWMKYQAAENPSNNPQRATVDLALYRRQTGDSTESVPQLEKTLRRDLIPIPP